MACAIAFPTVIKDRDFKSTVLARRHSQISCPSFSFLQADADSERGVVCFRCLSSFTAWLPRGVLGTELPKFHASFPAPSNTP